MTYQPNTPANLGLVADPSVGPRYQHDCDCCHFLGRVMTENGETDLYAHATGRMPTVLGRFSSDGPDYSSGLTFSYGLSSFLTEARERAQKLGLLDYQVYEALHYAKEGTPAYAELQRALPFTVEYQAVLAHERGNLERSMALVTYVVNHAQLTRQRYDKTYRRASAYYDAEGLLVKVLQVYRGYSWEQAYQHIHPMMEHEWELVLAEPSPSFSFETDDEPAELAA